MPHKELVLPDTVTLKHCGGDPLAYFEHLYSIFKRDFVDSQPILFGKKVFPSSRVLVDGKEDTFWHITSKGGRRCMDRLPDLRRSERLPWVRFAIENATDDSIALWWRQSGNRPGDTVIYLPRHNFVVILKEIKYIYVIITAHFIDYPQKKRDLLADYAAYKARSAQRVDGSGSPSTAW